MCMKPETSASTGVAHFELTINNVFLKIDFIAWVIEFNVDAAGKTMLFVISINQYEILKKIHFKSIILYKRKTVLTFRVVVR